MGNILKIMIVPIMLLSFFSYNSLSVEANAKKTAFVNVSKGSSLNVRSGANSKSKKVGSLKDGLKLVVYSKTKNGWSEIRYKKKKGYVSTKYLMFANSYLKDISKVYWYETKGKKSKEVYIGKSYYGEDIWESDYETYAVHEDKNGLYIGIPDFYYIVDIEYPVKVGRKWRKGEQGEIKAQISAVNKTVITPAGTFKNCIEVKHNGRDTYYYAQNIGLVKSLLNGKLSSQLISLE
ncbi:SH3 domain-containing protein [Peribacillus sp. NPDC097197]|uniref:SH3 domain-containing protein n=1 Tax=Peribacillus sp. NPDC097197 TaxID=3390615 RepID=UPI003D09221A